MWGICRIKFWKCLQNKIKVFLNYRVWWICIKRKPGIFWIVLSSRLFTELWVLLERPKIKSSSFFRLPAFKNSAYGLQFSYNKILVTMICRQTQRFIKVSEIIKASEQFIMMEKPPKISQKKNHQHFDTNPFIILQSVLVFQQRWGNETFYMLLVGINCYQLSGEKLALYIKSFKKVHVLWPNNSTLWNLFQGHEDTHTD